MTIVKLPLDRSCGIVFKTGIVRFALVALAAAAPPLAHAWGSMAHQAIATVAYDGLSPQARAQVDRLLAAEPGSSLASISMWADEHRSPTTSAWHYINFPLESCVYDVARDCPDGACLVAALDRQIAALGTAPTDAQRLLALKYVVHLMADLYQPLHAGLASDKGGNTVQLRAFGRGTNLHALWDTGLVSQIAPDAASLVSILAERMPASKVQESATVVTRAAEASCQIVRDPDFYPHRTLEPGYLRRWTPVLLDRMRLASTHLSETMNRVLR